MIHVLLALYLSLTAVPVITLERTQCLGPCPIYKLTIYDDGKVEYEGKQYVKRKGKAEGRITKEQLQELVREFEKIDYFDLADSYAPYGVDKKTCPEAWTDYSAAITSLNWKDRKKTVSHYLGCRGTTVLDQLNALENKIDRVVSSDQWIK
jgi:hypothetical protein